MYWIPLRRRLLWVLTGNDDLLLPRAGDELVDEHGGTHRLVWRSGRSFLTDTGRSGRVTRSLSRREASA